MSKCSTNMEKPIKPQVIAHELGQRLRGDAIVSSDSGTITTWWARHILAKRGQMYSCSGTLATMACGLPYTSAAQIAFLIASVLLLLAMAALACLWRNW